MPKVNVGDLVCLYRRKNKGLGIVIEKIEDASEEAGLDVPLSEVITTLTSMKRYGDRIKYRDELMDRCNNPKAAKVFFTYNGHGWCKKPKYKFARIRWFKKPSAYESMSKEEENWCPEDWLKKV